MHPPQQYDLKPSEQQQLDEILESVALHGGLFRTDRDGHLVTDAAGNPAAVDYVVLRSRRYCVDAHGTLWRFFAEGSPKNPGAPDRGGAPWRSNRVQMWTGRWRKVVGDDGRATWAKVLTPRPIDKRINGHPGMSQIDWYLTRKGYKHPLDEPHAPSEDDLTASTPMQAEAAAEPTPRSNQRSDGDAAG